MRKFLLSLKIRVKLLAAFGSILLLSVLLIIFSISSINTILEHKAINEDVDELKLHQETLDLAAREFLHEGYKSEAFLTSGKAPSIDAFRESYQRSKKLIEAIGETNLSDADRGMTMSLIETLDSLANDFSHLVALLEKRGFRDYGSEGSLRGAIHEVENSGFNIDKVAMLTLRRHEKDFFLRKDLKYLNEFNDRIATFRSQLSNDPALTGLVPFVDNYSREFNNVVAIEREIGLKDGEGIRGKIRERFKSMRAKLDEFRARIRLNNERKILNTKIILGILFVVQIVAGLAMAIIYANLLTTSIKEIRHGMKQLAAGVFPDKLTVKTTEEIGQTKVAFNQFVDRLKAATDFASSMANAKTSLQYDERFADDVLARSLMDAKRKLSEADVHQAKINWANQGIASFNEILKNEAEEIASLADKVVKKFVDVMQANQGALYLVAGKGPEAYLERTATFAYGKRKFENHRLEIGQGIPGQSFLEASTVHMTEVPRDYVRITSGLGEATPRNILIVPLKVRATVMGLIELASFRIFEPHEIEFAERIAESVATMLSNKQASIETKRLLDESQHRASVLAQQEEEMRQNAEELQATQEEMERQRRVLEDEIRALKSALAARQDVNVYG